MKHQGFQTNSAVHPDRPQHQSNRSRLPLRVGLATLLLMAGNTLINMPAQANVSAPLTAQTPINAQIVYVNPVQGIDSTGRGNEATPYKTITYALQQAQPGTIIQLAAGSYTRDTGEVFPLVIPQNVSLQGDRSTKGQTVTISGGGNFVSPSFASQNITIRPLNNSVLNGVRVTNPNTRGTAVWVESTNPTIQDSTFADSLRDGIFVTGTGAPRILSNVFIGNSGNGISVTRNAQGEIRDNIFQSTGFGIAIGGSSAPRVQGNQVLNNTDGIVVSDSARPVLRSNVVQNNTRDGVVAIANAQPDLGNATEPGENLIRNNKRYDLYNATRTNRLMAIGNAIDNISGQVEFVAREVNAPTNFPDVQGTWAQAYIQALANQGIIGGFPDGTYRPNEPVTRAQFAAILNKAFNPTPKRAGTTFADVPSNFWGTQAIQTAVRGGFLSGYPGQVFRPNQQISRLEVLLSLTSGLNLNAQQPGIVDRYQDVTQIPNWAKGPVAAATERNIVVNYPNINQLNPGQSATRADVAALVYQALASTGRVPPIPSPYLVNTQAVPTPQLPQSQPLSPQPQAPQLPQLQPQPSPQPPAPGLPSPQPQPTPSPTVQPSPLPPQPQPAPSPTVQPSPLPPQSAPLPPPQRPTTQPLIPQEQPQPLQP